MVGCRFSPFILIQMQLGVSRLCLQVLLYQIAALVLFNFTLIFLYRCICFACWMLLNFTFCWPASRYIYQLYIYSIPPDDGLQICPKHVEVDWRNKLTINSASSWFLLPRYIEMYGKKKNEKKKGNVLCFHGSRGYANALQWNFARTFSVSLFDTTRQRRAGDGRSKRSDMNFRLWCSGTHAMTLRRWFGIASWTPASIVSLPP